MTNQPEAKMTLQELYEAGTPGPWGVTKYGLGVMVHGKDE